MHMHAAAHLAAALTPPLAHAQTLLLSQPQVKRFALHPKPVRHISFDDKAEFFASCCGESYVSVRRLLLLVPLPLLLSVLLCAHTTKRANRH